MAKGVSKDEIFRKVLNAAIELDFRKGHQRWTLSELSRTSKITRSLIYYYFGKSRHDILIEAVRLIGEDLFGLSAERMKLWEGGQVVGSVLQSRAFVEMYPFIGAFYLANRTKDSDLGAAIRRLEEQHFLKMKRFFPKLKDTELRAKFALFFGLVFAPHVSEEGLHKAVRIALRFGQKGG